MKTESNRTKKNWKRYYTLNHRKTQKNWNHFKGWPSDTWQNFGTDRPVVNIAEEKWTMYMRKTQKDFGKVKEILTEGSCLAHYAKDKENIVTTDASTSGLGITLWQEQDDGSTKPIAFGSRHLNETGKVFNRWIRITSSCMGLENFRYLYWKRVPLYTDHQAMEPLIKRIRCNNIVRDWHGD